VSNPTLIRLMFTLLNHISAQWRRLRQRRLAAEEAADAESQQFEEREVENLRRESEAFLARQMDEMQALAEEQRKAGLLLDDGAPVKLNVSLAPASAPTEGGKERAAVFGQEEEEDEGQKKRKVPLVKLDFSVAEGGAKAKERLEKMKASVPQDKETLFKSKVRWDGLSDVSVRTLFWDHDDADSLGAQLMIDRKLEPLVKRQMMKYLGELEDDDLIMFVLEHLKDHKGPQKLVEGLDPVRHFLLHSEVIHLNPFTRCRYLKKKLLNSQSASGDKSSSRVWHTVKAYIRRE
jgi:RNA-binding protein 25